MTGRIIRLIDHALDRVRVSLDERSSRHYEDAPLCEAPLAEPAEYRRIWAEARQQSYPVVDRYEETSKAAIDPAWFQQLALLTQVPIKQ
jgi:hypothetical protein